MNTVTAAVSSAYQSPTERLKAWVEGAVLHLSFNNVAKHNAISVDMWEAVPISSTRPRRTTPSAWWSSPGRARRPSRRARTSRSSRTCAPRAKAVKKYEHMAENALMGLYRFSKPVVAAIRGYCIGGGLNMAISCDIRIATSDSVFSIPATRLGLGYRFSALKNLVDLVGPGAAQDIFYTGRRLDAEEAKSVGLVNRIATRENFDALLGEYVNAITTGAPLTIKAGKRIIREVLKADSDIDMDLCQSLIKDCFESEDYAEGRRAFMEKRKPVFKGK
jgi:enoyl-CoA hydratase/carnithine racemase